MTNKELIAKLKELKANGASIDEQMPIVKILNARCIPARAA